MKHNLLKDESGPNLIRRICEVSELRLKGVFEQSP
jgi:hypothetical protein